MDPRSTHDSELRSWARSAHPATEGNNSLVLPGLWRARASRSIMQNFTFDCMSRAAHHNRIGSDTVFWWVFNVYFIAVVILIPAHFFP